MQSESVMLGRVRGSGRAEALVMKNLPLWACGGVAVFAILAGGGGMCLSLLEMSCAETNQIIAGGACFIAGAVLVGAGVVALAVVALAAALTSRDSAPPRDERGGA
jgi:hypothetical protein